jgi:sec-independent protein translocase protein TatA
MFDDLLRPGHLLVIVLLLVLLFGSKRLPDAARGLGRSLRIFKSELNELKDDPKPGPAAGPATSATEVAPKDPANPETPPRVDG